MKVIVAMGHPAHFHLFKNFISRFIKAGNEAKIVVTDKDILKSLLIESNFDFEILAKKENHETLFKKGMKIIRSSIALKKVINKFHPDIIIGSISQIAYSTFFTNIPSLFFGEDDINYTFLQGIITYPFISKVVAPVNTKVSFFYKKKISYPGYQKLAYLHPNCFIPNYEVLAKNDIIKPYFLIRIVGLEAYHDKSKGGITSEVLDIIIKQLLPHGYVYISSENKLPDKYSMYKLRSETKDIHHILAFSKLLIGDSQSMAVEAAMLGTPSIRFNNFAGRISVLEELENKYGLTFGIKATEPHLLFNKIDEFINNPKLKKEFEARRLKMISDKIDVTAFILWFIINYPLSKELINNNVEFWSSFK